MENLSWRAVDFVLNAAAQNTNDNTGNNEEALFLVGLIVKERLEQKRQLKAAWLDEIKTLITDYEAASPVQGTSPSLMRSPSH
ncbi:TPA: hypothetical protein ACX6S8_002643 [Photobacterium damselae]|uniref:hypothetical protein n=1 Tax=Photobacterium damselae TaxID=38293 RepID=UPI001EFC77E7|nr:hypothetical protein [Photobacterium damselae]MCG9778716.1 hypothetical protein [Photobacterium damselae]